MNKAASAMLLCCLLWVSYYASHEGKTAIYLAKVEVTLQ
jgi:hypothetical protein